MARSQSPGTKTIRSKASSTTGQKKTGSKCSQTQQTKSSPKKNTTRAKRKSTQQKLEENLKTLTSAKQPKKTGKTSGTQKAKAETKTKTTSKQQTKKPSGKSTTRQKRKDPGIKAVRSYDQKLFPWATFSYRLDDKREKKVCHFQCFEHAEKYITRYKMLPKEYKLSYDFHALGAQKD